MRTHAALVRPRFTRVLRTSTYPSTPQRFRVNPFHGNIGVKLYARAHYTQPGVSTGGYPVAPQCAQTSAQRGKSMHFTQVFELWLASSLALALVWSIVSAVC